MTEREGYETLLELVEKELANNKYNLNHYNLIFSKNLLKNLIKNPKKLNDNKGQINICSGNASINVSQNNNW